MFANSVNLVVIYFGKAEATLIRESLRQILGIDLTSVKPPSQAWSRWPVIRNVTSSHFRPPLPVLSWPRHGWSLAAAVRFRATKPTWQPAWCSIPSRCTAAVHTGEVTLQFGISESCYAGVRPRAVVLDWHTAVVSLICSKFSCLSFCLVWESCFHVFGLLASML